VCVYTVGLPKYIPQLWTDDIPGALNQFTNHNTSANYESTKYNRIAIIQMYTE